MVAANQYEVSDRFHELKDVWLLFKKRGKCCKPDLQQVRLIGTGPLFNADKFVSTLAYIRNMTNYGEWIIYEIQTNFIAIEIILKLNHPFLAVIFKQALQ